MWKGGNANKHTDSHWIEARHHWHCPLLWYMWKEIKVKAWAEASQRKKTFVIRILEMKHFLKYRWNESISHSKTAKSRMMNYYFPLNTKIETTEFVFYLKVIPWLIGYWISTTTKEGFLFAGQKFRFDWCSWNFFCPSTQNGNVWDIRDKIYLWIIFFREPQTKDISPAETKKISKWILGYHQKKTELKGITLSGLFQRLI